MVIQHIHGILRIETALGVVVIKVGGADEWNNRREWVKVVPRTDPNKFKVRVSVAPDRIWLNEDRSHMGGG